MPICWIARCISVFGLWLSFKSCTICCKPFWFGCHAILLSSPLPVVCLRPRSVEVGTDIGGIAKTGNKSLQGSTSGQKELYWYVKNMVIISTFLLSSTDKYISGIWRIVARLTGDQMKGIRGKIRITVRVGRTSVSDIQLTADTLKLLVELAF